MSSLEMSVKNPCKETTTTLRCRNHVGCMFCPLLLFGSFSKSEKWHEKFENALFSTNECYANIDKLLHLAIREALRLGNAAFTSKADAATSIRACHVTGARYFDSVELSVLLEAVLSGLVFTVPTHPLRVGTGMSNVSREEEQPQKIVICFRQQQCRVILSSASGARARTTAERGTDICDLKTASRKTERPRKCLHVTFSQAGPTLVSPLKLLPTCFPSQPRLMLSVSWFERRLSWPTVLSWCWP